MIQLPDLSVASPPLDAPSGRGAGFCSPWSGWRLAVTRRSRQDPSPVCQAPQEPLLDGRLACWAVRWTLSSRHPTRVVRLPKAVTGLRSSFLTSLT